MINHEKLIRDAVWVLQQRYQNSPKLKKFPFWGMVADTFGVGSTTACEICSELGFHCDIGKKIIDE